MNRPERLSALDASFLFIESSKAPSHGGFVSIVDGPIDFELFRAVLSSKLPALRRYRQVIQRVPLNLAHPSWVTAADFNLDDHVHHIQLDPPEPERYAHDLLIDLFHQGLDHNKPLWSIHVVNGIEGNRSAIINMAHHCMVDGAADGIVTETLFDRDPVDTFPEEVTLDEMPPIPGAFQSLMRAILDDAADAAALLKRSPKSIVETVRGLLSPAFSEGYAAVREFNRAPALRFPFNAPPSGKVELSRASFPLADMRLLSTKHGGTINDVLLTAVTGGLQRYAHDCGLDTAGKYFKFQMPANVRMQDQEGRMGNFAAPVPVHVPLDIDDPLERLSAVIECTRRVKRLKLAMGFYYAIQTAQTLLTPLGLRMVEKLYGSPALRRLEASFHRTPGTNMFVTNIPRPQVPLYVAGRRILSRHVLVPLLPNQSMVCGALTYDQQLEISYTGDASITPGVDALMRYTVEAFELLVQTSQQDPAPQSDGHGESKPVAGVG